MLNRPTIIQYARGSFAAGICGFKRTEWDVEDGGVQWDIFMCGGVLGLESFITDQSAQNLSNAHYRRGK